MVWTQIFYFRNLFSDYSFPDAGQDSGANENNSSAADMTDSDSNQISKYVTYNPSLFELADADAGLLL